MSNLGLDHFLSSHVNAELVKLENSKDFANYNDRVAFVASIVCAFRKHAMAIDPEYKIDMRDVMKKLAIWFQWPTEYEVSFNDIYTYMFSTMDIDELNTWYVSYQKVLEQCLEEEKSDTAKTNAEYHRKVIAIIEDEITKRKNP